MSKLYNTNPNTYYPNSYYPNAYYSNTYYSNTNYSNTNYSNTYSSTNNMPSTWIMERLEYLLWRNTEQIKN